MSKIGKWLKKQPKRRLLFWALVVVFGFWMYRRYNSMKTPSARVGTGSLENRVFDPNRVYKMIMLTDTSLWEQRYNVIAANGFDTVQLVVPYSETYNGNFDFYTKLANYAASLGLNIVLKTWIMISNPMLYSEFSDSDLAKNQSGTALNNSGFTLSFNSPKWSKVYDWMRKVKAAFQPLQDAGYIVAHFPSTNETQEFGYSLENQGDWSQAETNGSGGLNQTRGIAYMNYQANQLREKLHTIANIFTGWRNGFDAGSFYYDFHKWAGSYNFEFITDHPEIWFIKNNPLNDGTVRFNGALCYDWKRRKGKYFSAEYANSPDSTTTQTLAENHTQMILDGCNLLSFAFHSPDANGSGSAFQKAIEVKNILTSNGLWNSNVKTPTKSGEFVYTLQELFDNGHTAVLNSFNTNPQRAVRIAS